MKDIATLLYWGCLAVFWYYILKGIPARRESRLCTKESEEVIGKMESLLSKRFHPSRANTDKMTLRDEYDTLRLRWEAIDDRWQTSLQEQKLHNRRAFAWFFLALMFFVLMTFIL